MSKRFNRNNLTCILHNLRESYAKVFHEAPPKNQDFENFLINAAKEVKSGKNILWIFDKNGEKKLILEPRKRY